MLGSQLIPNSTPIPNVALDLILPFLYESEAKVLLYILRRTYGFQRPEQFDQIALTQFADGIGNQETRKDFGTGISRQSVIDGLAMLTVSTLVEKVEASPGRGHTASYRLNLKSELVQRLDLLQHTENAREKIVQLFDSFRKGQTVRPITGIKGQTVRPEKVKRLDLQKQEKASKKKASTPPTPSEGETPSTKSMRRSRTTMTRISDAFQLTPEMLTWADEKAPMVDIVKATEHFIDHHRAKGTLMLNWEAAWHTWIRNARDKFNGPFKQPASASALQVPEPLRDFRGHLRPTNPGEKEGYFLVTFADIPLLAEHWGQISMDDHYEYGMRMTDELKIALAEALGCQRSDLYLYGQKETNPHAS